MNDKENTKSPDYRWTERRADLAAEREYLERRLAAVVELENLVRTVESRQEKTDDKK